MALPGDPSPTTARALSGYRIRVTRAAGTKVEYRNVNYALLGEVITRVTGIELAEHLSAHVLAPLGIRAGFAWTDELRARRMTGYLGRWDPMRVVLRWLFLSIAWTPGIAVAGQALHGVTFTALWVAGVSYAERQAPARLGATAQGLFSGTIYGISAIGTVVGGLVYAAVGPAALFQAAAVAAFMALLAFLGAHAVERR